MSLGFCRGKGDHGQGRRELEEHAGRVDIVDGTERHTRMKGEDVVSLCHIDDKSRMGEVNIPGANCHCHWQVMHVLIASAVL